MEYLLRLITKIDITIDLEKIEDMKNLVNPTSVKELKGFLGFMGYYIKFIRGCEKMAKPLTDLLKENSLRWFKVADKVFTQLNQAMI